MSLTDTSDQLAGYNEDGSLVDYTILEEYHWLQAGLVELETQLNRADPGFADLVPEGVVFLGGFPPGFGVYVESVDRVVDFRHDRAAEVQVGTPPDELPDELGYRVDLRILAELLRGMGWLP